MAANTQATRELGYTPFEYWEGPKLVLPSRNGVSLAGPPGLGTKVSSMSPKQALGPYAAQSGFRGLSIANTKPPFLTAINSMEVDIAGRDLDIKSPEGPEAHAPPAYTVAITPVPTANMHDHSYDDYERRWWDPRGWRKRVWAVLVIIIIVIVAVVPAVVVTQQQRNRYPDYTKLSYSLADTYSGETFFDKFDYFTGYDPSNGRVHYVPQEQAEQLNLTFASAETAILKVDTSVGPESVPDASTGRFSVRVESKEQYNKGLFIFDIKHTPYGCGSWPALWFADRFNWPAHGEIDVMEAVNQAVDGNQMTLHTSDNCNMDVKRIDSGKSLETDCDVDANDNAGCGVAGAVASYGTGFNDVGGGIMAVEWRDQGIRMWQFGRDVVPVDITNKAPDPSTWGTAAADFPNTNCNIGSHFKNQSLIININVCGDLVYAVYADSGCPSNCNDYQANNPLAFETAYWEFGAFDVYQAA